MDQNVAPWIAVAASAGLLAGLWLLVRGMGGYRTAVRIGDTSTSPIATMAAGEVRISGVIEAAEVVLVSPLQSEPCVYYRAWIRDDDDVSDLDADFHEERAVGFRVRDSSGEIRIFPRGARWDAPTTLEDRTSTFGAEPVGLRLRMGSAIAEAEPDRASAVAQLLTVRPVESYDPRFATGAGSGGRTYHEARLAPGDAVTIVGRAMPFSDLSDPNEADVALGGEVAPDDPEVAADLAAARAAGSLADDPEEAWGNAAIPGFGIGRPVRTPELDPEADPLPLAPADAAAENERVFHIPPEALVLAGAPDVPLLIAHGLPGAAVERHQDRFVVGLLGAVLAIGSAMALAVMLSRGFGA
ncbi:MAG TPA: hypothetical protein VD763_14230 [Candidatus Saccharimonadales bacterium]|nr:hypothetical protein [Candidatus Saccharimonadales bacterium]